MKTIYSENDGYTLTAIGDVVTLTNGARSQKIPLRHGTDEIPVRIAAALQQAGQNPIDYFAVAGSAVIRRAALPAWTAAVEARIAERLVEKADKEAAISIEIAARGKRALVLHGGYLLNSSLVFVRPMDAAESERFVPELRATGMVALGEWTSIRSDIAQQFLMIRKGNDGWLAGQESVVILISAAEWAALESGNVAALEAEKAKKTETIRAEITRIETARQQAEQSGEPVEIGRFVDECDGTATDCSFDLVRRMIRCDGSRFLLRTHCH